MIELLKIIHFFSFSAAIGAGIANMIIGVRMATIPVEAGPAVGAIRLSFGKVSTLGLALLWLTGIGLIAIGPGSNVWQDGAFLAKIAFVVLLTGLSVMANMTVAKARQAGGPPDPARMKQIGMASMACASLALILAVVAFT